MTEMSRRDFGRTSLAAIAAAGAPHAAAAQSAAARSYRYIHLDVFTGTRLEGNQLFVYVQPAGLDADAMQRLTRESNLSENTFVLPPEQAGTDHRVRIFSRTAEMPFAGHPVIGTAFALAHTGALKPGTARSVFGLGIGPTNVDLEWKDGKLAAAWMTQLKPTFGKTSDDAAAVAAALGVDPQALRPDGAPVGQEVNCGSTFFVVPMKTRKAVDSAVLDRAKLSAMFAAAGIQGRGVYAISGEKATDGAGAYSRLIGNAGLEDPATGSAAGPAGAFAAKYKLAPLGREGEIVFLQGVLVGRPSRLHVRLAITGDEITGVKVGGSSVVVGEGTMMT